MRDTSFVSNIASGVEHLGLENSPIIWSLAKVPWESAADRDMFFKYLGGQSAAG